MGKGIDAIRDIAPEHAAAMDDFKDQLLVALLHRLGDRVTVPIAEVDATGRFIVLMSIKDGAFNFIVQEKQ